MKYTEIDTKDMPVFEAFRLWFIGLSEEERFALRGSSSQYGKSMKGYDFHTLTKAREYFEEHIWPSMQAEHKGKP
jgi:hypothetical protein